MAWFSVLGVIVYYTTYPVLLVGQLLFYIVHWLLSPFIYVGYVLKETALIPIRFLAEFEALWYFLGCAVLLGVVLAFGLHLIIRGFVLVFNLDRRPVPKPAPPTGHDAASYRAARQAKKEKELDKQRKLAMRARLLASQPLLQQVVQEARHMPLAASSSTPISPGTSRPTLLQETILEHTDEEDDDSVF